MPVTQRSCASGTYETKPETLKVGGYSSNGNVHENDIHREMLSSILHFLASQLLRDVAEMLLERELIGNVPGNQLQCWLALDLVAPRQTGSSTVKVDPSPRALNTRSVP